MVPEPRILALIAPDETCCAATSGSEAFMMVFEKNVRTSRIARKMMAAVLTHSRLFTFASICFSLYPFTEPEYAMPSTRYASPCKNSRRPGTIYTTAAAKAMPISPALMVER